MVKDPIDADVADNDCAVSPPDVSMDATVPPPDGTSKFRLQDTGSGDTVHVCIAVAEDRDNDSTDTDDACVSPMIVNPGTVIVPDPDWKVRSLVVLSTDIVHDCK